MEAINIENKVVDEANERTYVILAPRVLSDGEIYKAIRQELLRRGGRAPGRGETLTLSLGQTSGSKGGLVLIPSAEKPTATSAPQ